MTKRFLEPNITSGIKKRIKAAVELGFDSTWVLSMNRSLVVLDSKTIARFPGSLFTLRKDGFGNIVCIYTGPGITSREEFEAWPYWPKPDEVAHRSYKFFKKMMAEYGDKICLFGQASAYGIQESLSWALGFERMAIWIREERDLIQRYIDIAEELSMKTAMAMLDAGIPIILQCDDFAFKTGPLMNPKLIDELFGPSYMRIIKAVHNRGGKYILHSCGDNTLIFDIFIKWGVDGLHAYENTSNVDIFNEKKIHGNQVTIIGGVGIDYLLTDRSKDEEVVEKVKELVNNLGPKGRYIVSAVNNLSSIPAHKLTVMIDATKKYGKYPIVV